MIRQNGTIKRKKYTKEDDLFLINNYLNMNRRELSINLDRSTDSVKHRLSVLGLTLPERIKKERFRANLDNYRQKENGLKGENNPNWKGGRSKNNYYYKKIQSKRYPMRVEARNTLIRAIKSGEIRRGNCEVCGEQMAQGHHDDYNQPLNVRWLCRKHHRELHESLNKQ